MAGGDDGEPAWERPRQRLDGGSGSQRELLPVREGDGKWKRRSVKVKKGTPPPPPEDEEPPARDGLDEEMLERLAEDVKTAEEVRSTIATIAADTLNSPESNIGRLDELREFALGKGCPSRAVQRLALLSEAAVLRDLIPGYRIRELTEKELKMQVSREVEERRSYERKLLSAYAGCIKLLGEWLGSPLEAHRAAGGRGLCALLEKGYDFNYREELITALVPVANGPAAGPRAEACAALVRLFGADAQGDATFLAVKTMSALLRSSSFNVQPEVLATWLHLQVDGAAAVSSAEPSSKRAKKRKRTLDPVTRELAAASGERGNRALLQGRILEQVFVSYARVVKHGAHSPLLSSVLRGIAKFAHQVKAYLFEPHSQPSSPTLSPQPSAPALYPGHQPGLPPSAMALRRISRRTCR